MVYRGHIKNGSIVLDDAVSLPEGAEVFVDMPAPQAEVAQPSKKQTLADRLRPIIGVIDDLPPDFALNHDHYIHGTPKR